MSGVKLFLLGPPKIEIDGFLVKVDTRKVMALLAYLAAMGESYRRDLLVNLLWPEYDPTLRAGCIATNSFSTLHNSTRG